MAGTGYSLSGGGTSSGSIDELKELIAAETSAREEQVAALEQKIEDAEYTCYRIVSSIPEPAAASTNVIYLVKNSTTGYYDMYILDTASGEVVQLDDMSVDLSGYATSEDLQAVSEKVDSAATAANEAATAAEKAQSTADSATSAAEAAQSKADSAASTAETASTTATAAQEAAASAQAIAESLLIDQSLLAASHGLQRDGKIYGVKFPTADYSSSPLGTRTEDADGLTAEASTDAIAGVNDFDKIPLFRTVLVNGYLDENYNFVETAVEGDANFSLDGSNGDVYMRWQLRFFRYVLTDENYEELQLTDTYRRNEGWCTYSAFLNADGSLKPYMYAAKYGMGYGSDGKPASISGVCQAYNTYAAQAAGTTTAGISHNSQITIMATKGAQYCGFTEKELAVMTDQFLVEFATRNSQNIMYGCANYNYQKICAYAETGVERVLLTATDAANYEVGSCISVSATGLTATPDRGTATTHSTVNRKLITSKETVTVDVTTTDEDGGEIVTATEFVALNIDNGGVTFDTAADMYVSTMPWYTGACDGVLGSSGSPVSNAGGKYPMMYRGVENLWGNVYTVMSDVVISDYVPYICYDNTKFTSSAPTSDYIALNYTVYETTSQYVKELGYDENCPEVRYCVTGGGSASTYYCDYWYIASGVREVISGGTLSSGTYAGLFYRHCHYALSNASWARAARLSVCGLCGKAA